MFKSKSRIACLLATLATLAAAADPVGLRNDLTRGVEEVYCLDSGGEATLAAGAIPPGGAVAVSPDKLPDGCVRLVLNLDGGGSWQFALEAAPGSARSVVFSMDAPSAAIEEESPSLTLELEDDVFSSPAGGGFGVLAGLMQFGMTPAKWSAFAWPLSVSADNSGEFVVALGGQSWSLAGEGVVFGELVDGMRLAQSVTISAPFANPTVLAVFEELRALGCVPLAMEPGAAAGLPTEEETAPDQDGGDAEEDAAERLWRTLLDRLALVAEDGGGTALIKFDNEDARFELTLDLDAAKATLVISRKPEAAFG